MPEAVLNWPEIMAAIRDELANVQRSDGGLAFGESIVTGEPIGLPLGGPYACFWYLGRTDAREGRRTLGNVMYAARIQIMCLWQRQDFSTIGDLEADIATVDTAIRRRLRANSTINNNLTDLDIEDSRLDYGELPYPGGQGKVGLYRVLQMELRLDNLEGEAIAP